jgi:hypothetical protein
MDVLTAAVYGACGGVVVQAVTFCTDVVGLQQARHAALGTGKPLRPLSSVVDPGIDILVLVTRLALGAVAGLLFHASVSAPIAAVAVGASAPALLRGLASLRTGASLADGGGGGGSALAATPAGDPPGLAAGGPD